MKRHELEHILRAAWGITGADRIVVIGSQAILGQHPDAPPELLASQDADVFTFRDPADAELIEGTIGELSPFHTAFGYFAHGVGEETAILPSGWRDRLVPVRTKNTGGAAGLCLDVHDLAVSKLAAGRKKDLDYVEGLFRHRLVDSQIIRQRLNDTAMDAARRHLCLARLSRFTV